MDRASIRRASLALALALVSCVVVAIGLPGSGDAADDPNGVLHPDLLAAAHDVGAAPVEVIVVMAEQPVHRVARDVRPAFEAAIEAVRAPALAALERIEPLLPPREQRIEMGVRELMEREASLLTVEELAAIREARDETVALLGEMRLQLLAQAEAPTRAIQDPVVEFIEQTPGGSIGHRSVMLNAFAATVPPHALLELVHRFDGVAQIDPVTVYSTSSDTSVGTVGASSWTIANYNGAGQKVAVLDTGIDAGHPAFTTASNVAVVSASTVKLAAGSSRSNFADNSSSTDDLHRHGTHVGGIVASNDSTYSGVAPGTSLLNAKCFYKTTSGGGSAINSDILAAADWSLTNGATVINGSFGSSSSTTNGSSALSRYFDAVVDVSGVSVAIAAGNTGSSTSTIETPGDAFNIMTVGAFNDGASTSHGNDSLPGFTSRGPTSDLRLKPDITAPGYFITNCRNTWEGPTNDFTALHGTSMAAPHVAGAMALLLDYTTTWQPEVVKALLLNSVRNSSPVPTSPGNNWGFGAMNLSPAYTDRTKTSSGSFTSSGASTKFYRVSSGSAGDRVTLCWNRSVPYHSLGRIYGAGTAKTLVNLNLYLYDESDGDLDVSSASTVNSVEQVKAVAALTAGIVKVKRSGTFPTGQTSVSWGLASANAPVAVDPPTLTCTYTAPTSNPSGTFTVTVRVNNTGDIKAHAPSVTLTLPTGFSFTGGSTASTTLADIAGDGNVTTSWTVSPGTQTTGTLTVQASVTDYGETFSSSSVTKSITVSSSGANADAGTDINLGATSAGGRSVSLDGTGSTGSGLTYAWDTDNDGSYTDSPGSATGSSPSVAFAIGTHTVTLRVTDSSSNTDTDTVSVTIDDNDPVADAGPDKTANEGSSVSFSGTGSSDVEGTVTYAWNFGDGSTSTSATPTHTYADDGTYTVTLTVTDSDSQTDTDTATATISNVAPTANAGPNKTANEGTLVAFVGSATDPGSDTLTYSWAFGDGETATGASVTHAYGDEGTYTATLTVTDGDGGTDTDAAVVTIANVAPTANAGPNRSGGEGSAITFAGSATDPGQDTLSYAWNFGDGTTGTGAAPSHAYSDEGTYTATLTVTDGDGGSDTDTAVVTVTNVAPTANAGPDKTGNEGTSLSFSGSATDPGADTLTYAWNFGDGSTASGASATHTYADEGTFTATLTVNDGDGGTDTDTLVVTVANVAPTVNAGPNKTGNEGSSISFSGSATDPGTTDTLSYTWSFGDGTTASGASASHTYADDGMYTATLTVTDGDGGSATDTATVTIANVAPTANAGPDKAGNEGAGIAFSGSATDPGAEVFTYSWNFGDGSTGSGRTPSHAYADNGTYTVTLTVSDGDGGTDTDTATVTVSNVAPVANAGSALTAGEGTARTFAGSATDAGSADTFTYAWSFGDGTTGTGAAPSHAYSDEGTYTATLTVTDDDGASDTDTVTVTVVNVAPTANAGPNKTGDEGGSISLAGSATDPGGDTLTYSWAFGDGSTASGASVSHVYADNGTYTATLTVSDGDGGVGTDTAIVTVRNVPPTADAGPNRAGNEGSAIPFSGSATDPGTDTFTYSWNFGDGTTGSGRTPSHAFPDNGTYTVTLTVTDDDGGTDTDTASVTVSNVAPVANAGSALTAGEGTATTFAGSATDAGSADTFTYAWSFGDGTTGTGAAPSHAYSDEGTYTATLTVTDDDGASDTDTVTVTVVNVAPTANAGPNKTGDEGGSISLAGSATDPGGDTLTYSWAFGDGSTASGANVSHVYADNGTYTATLTVSDGDGGVDTDTAIVTVRNVAPTANAGPNKSGNEGTAIAFAGSATDPGTDTFTYSWNFGDGTTATGRTPSHAFPDNGTYTVTLTVTDDDGGTDTDTASVTVSNVAPVANAGADLESGEGLAAIFSGSATDAGSADVLTYAWSFGDGTTGTGAAPSHAYTDEGTYTATLTVTDDDGASDTDTLTVTVVNVAPTANAGSDRSGKEGTSISLSGSATDPGADTLTYAWNFGDGTTGTGATPSHTYADDGIYTATLTVSDGDGGVDTDTTVVTVSNVAPTADAGADASGDEGGSITFTGTGTDVPADPLTYSWNFGDGTTASGASVTHTFTDDDDYTVTLAVSDGDGGVTTDTLVARIDNVAPVAEAGAALTGVEGSGLTFGASATDAGTSDTHTFAWNFGDGTTGSGAAAVHAYVDEGTYTATLTVTDDDGGSSTDTVTVTVSNADPVADAGGARSGDEGSAVSFAGTATDAGATDVLAYSWSFGDGTTATGATASHTYVDDGTYTATLTVTDGDGGSDTSTSTVTVRNVAPVVTPGATAVSGGEGTTLVLSATATDAGTADTLSYAWDHGDATTATGSSTSHAYADDGTYAARVTVTDGDGGSTTATVTVTVLNIAPTASAGTAPAGAEGSSLAFAGSATDPGADTLTYTWNFGDGATASGASATHAYGDEGTYTATLTVSDGDGGTDTDTLSVSVTNVSPTANAGGALTGGEGSGLTFSGSATDPGADDVLAYAWNFGDGTTGTGATPSHTYADDGTYTATLTVTDGDGGSDTDVVTVTVVNVAPTGDAGDPLAIDEGGEATLTGTATDPGASDVISYAWDFGDGQVAAGASVTHTYVDDGVYTATLTVRDDDGGVATATTTVTVANVAPSINLLSSAISGGEGTPLLFSATATDPGTDTLTFTWDFGDGGSATGASVSRAYGDDGSFSAVLTVTDGDGGSTQDIVAVTVLNLPPVAEAGDALTSSEGAALAFVGSATDPGFSDVLTYTWDFGDGNSGTGATPEHTYADDGTYTATLTVSDGDATHSDTVAVTVVNTAPTAVAGDDLAAEEGLEIVFAGSGTDPGVTDTLTYLWDFGDGSTSTDPLASHVYGQDGTYTASLTVTDDDGASTTDTLAVSVANVAPAFELPGEVSHLVGEELALAIEATDPSAEDEAALEVSWRILESGAGDATGSVLVTGSGPAVSWMVDRSFTGLLEVTVRDDDDETVRTATVLGATAPFSDAVAPALDLGLDPRLENQVVSGLLEAQLLAVEDTGDGKRLKKAAKRVKRALRLLEKAGVSDGPTIARLQALLADLEAGVLPPADQFSGAPGATRLIDLIAALPGSSFRGKRRKRLGKALLVLQLKLRKGAGERALQKARKKAQKAADKLEPGPEAQWFVDSLSVL